MNENAYSVQARDLDLIRIALLHLTKQERSPPEAIFVSVSDLSAQWKTSLDDVERALEYLSLHGFIEGPGWFEADIFLFRKLTAKGRSMARAIGHPRDWTAIKAHYFT
jgi:hypothetical protein